MIITITTTTRSCTIVVVSNSRSIRVQLHQVLLQAEVVDPLPQEDPEGMELRRPLTLALPKKSPG
jgi:hypothetical protein